MELREGGDVEVASDEDGFKGAWFSARVVKKEKEKAVVEYRDLRSDKDESKALREKVALRHLRPPPPSVSPPLLHYALYQEVDAYANDGWWVGVVTKLLNNNTYLVYFMDSNEEIPFHHSQLRSHFDFIDNKWFQPSEALLGTPSLDYRDKGTILPYISCQTTGTRELPFREVNDNTSAPVRRSLRNRMIKRTGKTEGSPSSMKKARIDIVDGTITPYISCQTTGTRELPFQELDSTVANDAEIPGNVIAEKRQQKSCLKTSPSVVINTTILKAHTEVNPNSNVANAELLNLSCNNIASCTLETRKPLHKKMLNETYATMVDKDISMENTNSCTPSGSPGEEEKTYTVTIPHLEYVGYSKADQGNSGSLHGMASLRKLKLLAYHSVLQALYLQGAHNWKHEFLLTNLREALSISNEEHSIELRRLITANYD